MKTIAQFAVNKAITVFMAVIIIVIFGVVSYSRISTDLFPSMNIPYTVVVTTYIGASPEEIEDVVTNPIESTLATTTNVKTITSQSQENVSLIIMEFNTDANMDSAVIEMRENLDMVLSSLPEEVGSPMIIKLNPDMMPILQLSVSQEGLSQEELTKYVEEDVLPQIERVAGVASVDVSGAYESEVRVVIDDAELAAINTDLEAMYTAMSTPEENQIAIDKDLISNVLMAQNFEFPVGYIEDSGVNYLVRVGDEFSSVEELNGLILFDISETLNTMVDGILFNVYGVTRETAPQAVLDSEPIASILNSRFMEPVTLADFAEVSYVNANDKEYAKINGENAITFTVQKSSSFATTDVTKEVLAVIAEIEDLDGTDFTVLLDQGEYIEQATGSVTDNLLIGAVLAVIVLIVFLRSARATSIVALAIPISLMFAIVLIYLSGITLNIVSLGGLALGVGMLVDNAIVVMENIFRMKKMGHSNKDAAIEGTKQVGGAIVASTITTIAVFVPIIFIEGFIKEIFMQMAMTIAFSLVASLLVALTVVPAISSKILKEETKEDDIVIMEAKYKTIYGNVLGFAFKFKAVILVVIVVLFGLSIGLALGNGFEYLPSSDEGQLTVSVVNPTEDPLSYDDFVALLDSITEDVLEYDDVETIGITLGSMQGMFMGFSSTDEASVSIILKDDRSMSTDDFMAEMNGLFASTYDAIEYEISGSQQQTAMLTGSGIQVEIHGYDLDTLADEASNIADIIQDVEGIQTVDNGIGKPAYEYKITVDKDQAIAYNLTVAQVLGAVAATIASEEVVTQINVEGSLYDVYVYDGSSVTDETSFTVEEIGQIIVGLDFLTGLPVTVDQVASVEITEGMNSIAHVDGTRSITVSAEYEDGVNTTEVAQDVEDALSDYQIAEGYDYLVLGENEEVMEAVNVMVLAILLGVVLIYMIMASQFQSLTYPFIIMFTIPLAFTGGFAILWLANMTVSVVALIGLVILVGVVVNNGIVLVDYTNQLREQDYTLEEALFEAGKTRLRPIIMTALTTILALSTMALGFGQGSEMMQPMAVTTVGGLLYATVLTLLVVPIMYYLVTMYSKYIFGFGLALVIAVASLVAFVLLDSLVVLIVGAILALAIVAFVIVSGKKVVSHE
jgi:HAE1 family hydrophobic/amphiphilic exporter-1